MLDVFNTPTPQGANYQEFYGSYPTGAGVFTTHTWVKPRGVSMVRMMLIGPGGGGGNGTSTTGGGGGGSGAITSWIGPAIFIPDTLIIAVGRGGTAGVNGTDTIVRVEGNAGTGYYTILSAYGGSAGSTLGGGAGTAMSNNFFGACGIFTSITGQDGTAGTSSGTPTSVAASTTTFLSGGAGGAGSSITGATVTPNYGYPASVATPAGANKGQDGYFITQPILVGRGGAGGGTTTTAGGAGGIGGIGCGGGGAGEDATTGGGKGGDGAVFIWSW